MPPAHCQNWAHVRMPVAACVHTHVVHTHVWTTACLLDWAILPTPATAQSQYLCCAPYTTATWYSSRQAQQVLWTVPSEPAATHQTHSPTRDWSHQETQTPAAITLLIHSHGQRQQQALRQALPTAQALTVQHIPPVSTSSLHKQPLISELLWHHMLGVHSSGPRLACRAPHSDDQTHK